MTPRLLLLVALSAASALWLPSPPRLPRPRLPRLRLCAEEPAVLVREEGEGTAERNLRAAAEEDATALLTAAQLDGVQLSLTLCDDAFIHALNLEWRSRDRPTDVLSFPLDDDVLLGDVVISLDTAAAQAAQRGHELRDELRVLLVHGLLHVLGYDHELGALEHGEMAEAEQRLLRRLGWTGDGLIDAVDRG